ncbi:hypothetical protein Tco_1268361 [Tanacetum coccineum]
MTEIQSPFFFLASNDSSVWRDLFVEDGFGSVGVAADGMSNFWCGIVETIVSAMSSMMSCGGVPVADEHRDFALRVNRLIREMNEAGSDRGAFVWELQSVTGETVPAMSVVFLEKMMDKEGNKEWQLRDLEKEAREMAFEIESFLFKLMDAELSHKRVFYGDDGQRG